MTAVFALAISVGNFLNGQLAENFGWLALPWQKIIFCSLAFLVTYFGIRPRLKEGTNEPEPDVLLIGLTLLGCSQFRSPGSREPHLGRHTTRVLDHSS
jgi:hypothetical protein